LEQWDARQRLDNTAIGGEHAMVIDPEERLVDCPEIALEAETYLV
jgi:hypothetical protein